jgi:hypothetical protein
MRQFSFASLLTFLLISLCSAVTPVMAIELMSHRAIYDLELARSRSGAGLASLEGRLVIDFAAQCEGSTVSQRMVESLVDAEGGRSLNDFSTSSWEANDGTSFRFSTRQVVDGETQDQTDGSAELDAKGKGGAAIFNVPKGRRVSLPAGAIFPSEFNAMLIEAARRGDRHVSQIVFDGSADVDVYHAAALISPEQTIAPAKSMTGSGASTLVGVKSWIVSVSYYKPGDREGLPDYEVTFRMYPNGVSGDLTIDYGDFAVRGRLIRLDKLPKSRC